MAEISSSTRSVKKSTDQTSCCSKSKRTHHFLASQVKKTSAVLSVECDEQANINKAREKEISYSNAKLAVHDQMKRKKLPFNDSRSTGNGRQTSKFTSNSSVVSLTIVYSRRRSIGSMGRNRKNLRPWRITGPDFFDDPYFFDVQRIDRTKIHSLFSPIISKFSRTMLDHPLPFRCFSHLSARLGNRYVQSFSTVRSLNGRSHVFRRAMADQKIIYWTDSCRPSRERQTACDNYSNFQRFDRRKAVLSVERIYFAQLWMDEKWTDRSP